MSIIKASCVDQTLRLTNTPVIASGGVGEDFVEFTFCPLWDGYNKTGVFYNNRGVFYSILDDKDTCVVPCQALELPGNLFIAVFGYKDGVTRTSEVLQYQIVEGAITVVPDPDPDVYAQITQEIAELRAEWEGVKINSPVKLGAISLSAAAWVKSGEVYSQTVTVENTTTKSLIALQPTPEQWNALKTDGITSLQVANTDGVFTAWATGAAPSTDLDLQVSITEAGQGAATYGMTVTFGGVSSGDDDPITPEAIGAAPVNHTHTKAEITDFPSTMTPSAHSQAASTITAGTLAGQVNANATAAATVGTAQVRDIYAGTSDMTAGTSALTSGVLYLVYE